MEAVPEQACTTQVVESGAVDRSSPPPFTAEVLALLAAGKLVAFQTDRQWRLATPEAVRQLEWQPPPARGRKIVRWLSAGLLLAILILGSAALYGQTAAAGGSSVIPYQGYLEENGGPAEGQRFVTACLYRALDSTDCVWTEGHLVEVSAGRFSMNLGSDTSLDTIMHDGGNLYLGLTVDAASNGVAAGQPVALAGKQLLGSAPYARRGAPGKDFAVDGALNVTGALNAGNVISQSATVAGPLSIGAGMALPDSDLSTGSWSVANSAGSLQFARSGSVQLELHQDGQVRGATYGFGGLYQRNRNCSPGTCLSVNPYTGDCSCPAGFTAQAFAIVDHSLSPACASDLLVCTK